MRIHVRHVRAAGMCGPGLRLWAAYAQIDLREFCRDGIEVDAFSHLAEDPFVVRALAEAVREQAADAQ